MKDGRAVQNLQHTNLFMYRDVVLLRLLHIHGLEVLFDLHIAGLYSVRLNLTVSMTQLNRLCVTTTNHTSES